MPAVVRAVNDRPSDLRVTGPAGRAIVVEWFRRGSGLFGVDRRCPRDLATHGRFTVLTANSVIDERRILPVDKVDAAVRVARAAWPASAELPRPAVVASRCLRCDQDRVYHGLQPLIAAIGVTLNLSVETKKFMVEIYACDSCGSMELFLPRGPNAFM